MKVRLTKYLRNQVIIFVVEIFRECCNIILQPGFDTKYFDVMTYIIIMTSFQITSVHAPWPAIQRFMETEFYKGFSSTKILIHCKCLWRTNTFMWSSIELGQFIQGRENGN